MKATLTPSVLLPARLSLFAAAAVVLLSASLAWAVSGGSLSGTVKDQDGGGIPGAKLTIVNNALRTEFKATTAAGGDYVFPNLAVGQYTLTIDADGFRSQKKENLTIDADSAVRFDPKLELGSKAEEVTVVGTAEDLQTTVETTSTQLGEVVTGVQIAARPLNGRSYTLPERSTPRAKRTPETCPSAANANPPTASW